MLDILLDGNGDLAVTKDGDISITYSIRHAVLVRLRWIYGEWRLGPDFGFRWFEEVFVKNPNVPLIKQMIRDEILEINGVTSVSVDSVEYNAKSRAMSVSFRCAIGDEIYEERVILNG